MLEKHCCIISDFTVSSLKTYLAEDSVVKISSTTSAFDSVELSLIDGNAACWSGDPDVAVVWTRPNAVIHSFTHFTNGQSSIDQLLAEVDLFCDQILAAADRVKLMIVPSWVTPSHERGLGCLNLNSKRGMAYALMRMNLHLIERLDECEKAVVLDANRWAATLGEESQNPKYWYLGKIAFSPSLMHLAAKDIRSALRGFFGLSKKAIVLDLDDTLWGGVVGDVGWQGIDLGGHSPNGEAFVDFQIALKELLNRGVILTVCSKNTEAIALEAIDKNPSMVLSRGDLAAWRINWEDKAKNICELAAELNIGLDSMVFIDDNPVERDRVRNAIPEVFVPEWPTSKMHYSKVLKELDCFDQFYLNSEDMARTKMYVAERERKSHRTSMSSVDDYLKSLNLVVEPEPINASNIKRVVQLVNKTNQMNLRTRRMTEEDFMKWSSKADSFGIAFRVHDRFGDYGITGVCTYSKQSQTAFIEDFILSCRVMGRGIERAMLGSLALRAKAQGLSNIQADYLATEKNMPCEVFFSEKSSFFRDGSSFKFSLAQTYEIPEHLSLGEK